MLRLEGYRLAARSPFRIGKPGISQEDIVNFISSDTLFGALCVAIEVMFGPATLQAWVDQFKAEPPLLISSAFPYYKDLRFYRRPQLPPEVVLSDQKGIYRKLDFVSEGIYRQLLDGKALTPPQDEKEPVIPLPGKVWATEEEVENLPERWWTRATNPHVAVDRVSSRSALYYASRIIFAEGGGYHFLVRWLDENRKIGPEKCTARDLLNGALWYLSDTGLGSDRSTGHGQFVYPTETQQLEFNDVNDYGGSNYCWTALSLYHPQKQEWENLQQAVNTEGNATAYELSRRIGWISAPGFTTLQRKPVWMLAEGACLDFAFPGPATSLGDLAEVSPVWENIGTETQKSLPPVSERPEIYRYGRALVLPMRKEATA